MSLEEMRNKRANTAKAEMAEEAQRPTADTPAATRDAMKEARLFAIRNDPSAPDVAVLRKQHGALFDEYMQSAHSVHMGAERVEGDAMKIAEGRVQFLERLQYTEQIRAMITPKLLENVMNSEFLEKDEAQPLKTLLGRNGTEATLDIIQKELLPMACRTPDVFENFAKSVEISVLYKTSDEYKKVDKEARAVLAKIPLDTYKEMQDHLAVMESGTFTPEQRQEKEDTFRGYVRDSKGVFSLLYSWSDKAEQKRAGLTDSIEDDQAEYDLIDGENEAFENGDLARYRAEAELHQDEPEHPSHGILAHGERALRMSERRLEGLENRIKKNKKEVKWRKILSPVLEALTTKKEADRIAEAIPDAEEALEMVNTQMKEVQGALIGVMEGNPAIRAEAKKADDGVRALTPTAESVYKAGESPAAQWRANRGAVESAYERANPSATSGERGSRRGERGAGLFAFVFSWAFPGARAA